MKLSIPQGQQAVNSWSVAIVAVSTLPLVLGALVLKPLLWGLLLPFIVLVLLATAAWRQAQLNKHRIDELRRIAVAGTNAHLRASKKIDTLQMQLRLLTEQRTAVRVRPYGLPYMNVKPSAFSTAHELDTDESAPSNGLLN